MTQHRAVFLDLNGTLVTPVLVGRLADLTVIEGATEGVERLCRVGFVCPVITVQSRIEKGLFSEAEFRTWFHALATSMADGGAHLTGPYVCPHRFSTPCECAKPQTLLYERAATDHHLNLSGSFTIGDTAADAEAATGFGGRGCVVRTGYAARDTEARRAQQHASYIGDTFEDVVDWILAQEVA